MAIQWSRGLRLALLASPLVGCAAEIETPPVAQHETRSGVEYRVVQLEGTVAIDAGDQDGWLAAINQQLGGDTRRSTAGGLRVHAGGPLLLQVSGTFELAAGTRVEVPDALYLRAERIVLGEGAVLRVAGATHLHAHTMGGTGRLDASAGPSPALEPVEAWSIDEPAVAVRAQPLLEGDDGDPGDAGGPGDDGDDARCSWPGQGAIAKRGGAGEDGEDGEGGQPGQSVTVTVGSGAPGISVHAGGGDGGDGGDGGAGGTGGAGCCGGLLGLGQPRPGADGGTGGDGGAGGNGGPGGHVVVRHCGAAPPILFVDVEGGDGGLGGAGGPGGYGGAGGACFWGKAGNGGAAGVDGAKGTDGADGSFMLVPLAADDDDCV